MHSLMLTIHGHFSQNIPGSFFLYPTSCASLMASTQLYWHSSLALVECMGIPCMIKVVQLGQLGQPRKPHHGNLVTFNPSASMVHPSAAQNNVHVVTRLMISCVCMCITRSEKPTSSLKRSLHTRPILLCSLVKCVRFEQLTSKLVESERAREREREIVSQFLFT